MNLSLLISALLMGLAGAVHCTAMCGVASATVVRACAPERSASAWFSFHLARAAGYAAMGAVAAASVSGLVWLGEWSPTFRPLWTMAHMAALALGLWLAIMGRQPAWLEQLGRSGSRGAAHSQPVRWQRVAGPTKAAAAGALWFAWPCGLLQSALMVAALANAPWAGALVMLGFALTSALGLGALPWLWRRLGEPARGQVLTQWVVRLSGAALAAGSLWALGHDMWMKVVAYCTT